MMKDTDVISDMMENLALVPERSSAVLLLRHSVRYPIPPNDYGNDVPLTPEGVRLARELGRRMDRPIGRVFSSPVGRCIETGRAILRGAGRSDSSVEIASVLSELFVRDVGRAGPVFWEHGPVWVVNRLLGDIRLPGMTRPREVVPGFADLMVGHMDDVSPGIHPHITHDSILGPVVHHLLGRSSITKEEWPRMLEGAFFWKEGERLCLVWRGRMYEIG